MDKPIDKTVSCSEAHCLGINGNKLFSCAKNQNIASRFGQLGRPTDKDEQPNQWKEVKLPRGVIPTAVSAGGDSHSGHSAVATADGDVYTVGCDRWQQLGLGSSASGSSGYTWKGGKVWQRELQRVFSLDRILPGSKKCKAVDVSCGNEHTSVLCDSGHVVTFGKGNDGQLGTSNNGRNNDSGPFLSTPLVSVALSVPDLSDKAKAGTLKVFSKENCSCVFEKNDGLGWKVANCSGVCTNGDLLLSMVESLKDKYS